MKAISLALIAAILLPVAVVAQERYEPRRPAVEQERPRFPILRKAVRQIRSGLRYPVGAVRETASFVRHDIASTIRGERRARDGKHDGNRYGYRGESAYPAPTQPRPSCSAPIPYKEYEKRRQMEPIYPQQQPLGAEALRQFPAPQPPPPTRPQPTPQQVIEQAPRQEPPPSIIAPKEQPTAPAPPKKETRKPETEPKPKSGNKPVLGKIEYPAAKRSGRPGFHFSPYAPYELLDTQDIEPGGLARDPGNGKIFRVPK